MEIHELIEKMKYATPAQNEQITEIAQEMLDEVKKYYPSKYNKYMTRVEQVYHQEHGLTEEEAKEAVSHFKNADGTTGAHWHEDSIRKAIESYPDLQKYPFWCVYYALNMVYSDFYDPSYLLRTYIKLAIGFLHDPDAPEDKVKRYIEAMKY